MKFLIPLLAAAVFSAGCTSTATKIKIMRHDYDIAVDSDPEGAHVYYSGDPKNPLKEFVGTTPCTYTPHVGINDGFDVQTPYTKYVQGVATFTALPPAGSTNLFQQTATFRCYAKYRAMDKIPKKLFFDLHRPPE